MERDFIFLCFFSSFFFKIYENWIIGFRQSCVGTKILEFRQTPRDREKKPIYRLIQDLRREEASQAQEMGRKPDFNANRWIRSPSLPTREYHRTQLIVRRVHKIPLQRLSFTLCLMFMFRMISLKNYSIMGNKIYKESVIQTGFSYLICFYNTCASKFCLLLLSISAVGTVDFCCC